jgi:hypothetical protein
MSVYVTLHTAWLTAWLSPVPCSTGALRSYMSLKATFVPHTHIK